MGKFIWITSGTVFLMILAAVWNFRTSYSFLSKNEAGLAPGKPLLTVAFGEGEELEILGMGISQWTYGKMALPTPKGIAAYFTIRTTGNSGYSFGKGKSYLKTDTRTSDGKRIGVRIYSRDADLLIPLRILGSAGSYLKADSLEMNGIVLELSDNAGNWNRGYGPHAVFEDNEGILIAGFGGWPRTGTTLHFRIGRIGGEPTEFELPNPNHGTKPATWTPTKLPSTVSDPDWELTLSEVGEAIIPGDGRFLLPKETFTDKISTGGRSNRSIDFHRENVFGAFGTDSYEESVTRKSGRLVGRGYRVPADEDLFKIRYRVRYLPNYPYPRSDFVIFASGKVSADGKTIEVTKRDGRMGITDLTIGKVSPDPDGRYAGSHTFEIQVMRKYRDAAEQRAINRFFSDWRDTTAAVFFGSKSASTGALERNSWGSSSQGARGSYEWSANWSGDLTPGTELHFGLMPEKPDVEVDFVIGRDSLIPK